MFSKLRYWKTLVDSTINTFSQEPVKNYTLCLHKTNLFTEYFPLKINDQPSAYTKIYLLLEPRSMVTQNPFLQAENCHKLSVSREKKALNRHHLGCCILISMWFVWCKLCRGHCPTLTSKHKWTPVFRATPWNRAWQQQRLATLSKFWGNKTASLIAYSTRSCT